MKLAAIAVAVAAASPLAACGDRSGESTKAPGSVMNPSQSSSAPSSTSPSPGAPSQGAGAMSKDQSTAKPNQGQAENRPSPPDKEKS
jgi:hypothetical protein